MEPVIARGASETTLPRLEAAADFEGGSCTVVSVDQASRVIRFAPTDHRDRGVAAWWYLKVSGTQPGETVTLELTGGSPGYEAWGRPDQATFSVDQKTWKHTAPGEHQEEQTVYRQQIDGTEAWFAWGPPFLPSDAQRWPARPAPGSPWPGRPRASAVLLYPTRTHCQRTEDEEAARP